MHEIIINYLIFADVNEPVLSYIAENKIDIFPVIADLLGKDFEFFSDKNTNIQKLKNGNENFKILEDGSIWFKTTTKPNLENQESHFYMENISQNENNKYSSITTNSFITFEQGKVVERKVIVKSIQDTMYDGNIIETTYNDLKKESNKVAYWSNHSANEIPNRELLTTTEILNEFGFAIATTNENINFHNDTWNFVLNGEYSHQNKINIDNHNRKTIFNKLSELKNNLLQKKNQEGSIKR